jgi:rhodanese-related sulfurtransferase
MKDGWMLRFARIALLATLAAPFACAQFTPPESAFSVPQAQLIQPEALNHMLQSARPEKPLVLQVGSHVLFAEAHIPGAEYIGPGSQPAGLQVLQSRVSSLSRNRFIVLYCGCCPWQRCPNVAPAFAKLREMGFSNVKVLYLTDNFGADWAAKGYPVEQGR